MKGEPSAKQSAHAAAHAEAASSRPMFSLRGVGCAYGSRTVVSGLDLTLERGEFVGLIGPNGAGKTTLLRAMTGAAPVVGGSIAIDGIPLEHMNERQIARTIACVPQRFSGGGLLRVRSLVLMGRYPHTTLLGGYSSADHAMAQRAMEQTDTLHLADRRSDELSGGELQRVLLARAFAQDADALLLDEPASHLDMGRSIELFDLLKMKHVRGATIVIVIHDLNLAALYCQRLLLLREGRLVADGEPKEVLTPCNLRKAYETELLVAAHPVHGVPQVLLLPGAASRMDPALPGAGDAPKG